MIKKLAFVCSSLDKELVKLAEKSAREREKREREKHEREQREREQREREAAEDRATTTSTNNEIHVKPIIETVPPDSKPKYSKVKMSNGDHDVNPADDLLRFALSDRSEHVNISFSSMYRFSPPLDQQQASRVSSSTEHLSLIHI